MRAPAHFDSVRTRVTAATTFARRVNYIRNRRHHPFICQLIVRVFRQQLEPHFLRIARISAFHILRRLQL